MILRKAAAPAKTVTAAEAAMFVQSGMWIDYGAVLAQPDVFDAALARRKTELHSVKIRACLSTRPRAILEEATSALAGSGPAADRLATQAWAIAHGVAMLMLDNRLPADDALIERLIDTRSLFPPQGRSSDESP